MLCAERQLHAIRVRVAGAARVLRWAPGTGAPWGITRIGRGKCEHDAMPTRGITREGPGKHYMLTYLEPQERRRRVDEGTLRLPGWLEVPDQSSPSNSHGCFFWSTGLSGQDFAPPPPMYLYHGTSDWILQCRIELRIAFSSSLPTGAFERQGSGRVAC